MGWLVRQKRRGVGWYDHTLNSISLPPFPLLLFFLLFLFLISIAAYADFKSRLERRMMGFRFALTIFPLLGILVVSVMMVGQTWYYGLRPRPSANVGSLPWGLVAVVVLLLVLAYYQPSFQSAWSRII